VSKTLKIANGDMVLSAASGQPVMVSGGAKLKQDLGEMLAVDELPDGFGAGLRQVMGSLSDDDDRSVPLLAQRHLRKATERLVQLQRGGAVRPDAERVASLTSLNVVRADGSKTDYKFSAAFRTVAGDTLTRSGVLSTQPRSTS
jgi:hypothetical protein